MRMGLVLTNVGKRFGSVTALKSVDLAIGENERHALIGPNGSGKSTLFNLISGAFPLSHGSIIIAGKRIDGHSAMWINRAGVARSFQINQVFTGMTVADNIRLAVMSSFGVRWRLTRRAAIWRAVNARTNHIIDTSPLREHAKALAGTLSYSNQRALEICIAVSTDPKVLLLDEPTAGMSREETHAVTEFIRQSASGRTLLVVEHDMDVVFSLAERISVLAGGTIVSTGTPEAIRNDERVQAAYLGVVPGSC